MMISLIGAVEINVYLHCALSCTVYCNRPCLFMCMFVCLFVCGSVTMITRNCVHLHQLWSAGEGSDHLQLIKLWLSHTPGKGCSAGWKFLAPPYYSQHAVFVSPLSAFFI